MENTWTQKELNEFDTLLDKVNSSHQMDRIEGRLDMHKFVKMHGKEKCDAMFAHLNERDKRKGK